MKEPSGRIAVTGRIRSFVKNPHGRLPVSCTVFVVKSYQDYLDSLRFTSYALRHGAGVAIHLGEFNPSIIPTKKLNVHLYLDPQHPESEEFLALPRAVSNPVGEVIKVYDSMSESFPECLSIEESWLALFNLEFDKEYTIDLSLLRPKGSTNNYGLVASGAVSFAYILLDLIKVIESERKTIPVMSAYSRLNEVLRRGGLYKNGAIVLHTDIDSPNVHEFLASEREDCPWVRLCLNLNQSANDKDILLKALPSVRSGDLFLVKKVYQDGQRLYHNVCLEVLLPHRGTCLLSHVNLGMISYRTVVSAFEDAMRFLVNLHPNTKVDKDGYYLPPTVDKQVGLGVIGLANFLAYHKVKYKDFVQALKKELDGESDNTLSHTLAKSIIDGYLVAARIAMSHNLERAFAVAPTANTSFYYRDFRGYTTTPEISPPISRSVIRVSETTEEKVVEYPPDVEIAAEVGWDVYFDLVDQWQRLMNITGLAHSISANWWSDVVVMNEEFINKWLDSNWLSLYYALPVSPEIQDKSELICDDLTCVSCAE